MTRFYVIVHDFRHVLAVFKTAREYDVFPVVTTAPQVVAALGAAAAVAMIDEAAKETHVPVDGFDVIFDVQNDIGAAMALLRRPKTTVYITAVNPVAIERLKTLGEQTNSRVLQTLPAADLDLGDHFHWESACRNVFKEEK